MADVGEKCGVFGVFGAGLNVSRLTYFGLYALQHRGQESAGMVSSDGRVLHGHRSPGLVSQVFKEKHIKSLPGSVAIGHTRYSTSGDKEKEYIQPLLVNEGMIALAHNGNLPSVTALADFLKEREIDVPDSMDSAMVAEAVGALVREGKDIEAAVEEVYPLLTGAFSILILTADKLIAIRDSHGVRPLSIGRLEDDYVFASETCAFNPIGAEMLRDVQPGEMVVVDKEGLRSKQLVEGEHKLDIFEFVYFSRPDSELLGKSVYEVRKNFGVELAREFPVEADVVIPVPETAIPVAVGFANASGTPFEMGLVKSRYIHRTFIEPEQLLREQGVKMKLAPIAPAIKGKRVVVVDDSIVRGTTSKQIVQMLFDAGAREVHMLVSSPPVKYPDFYGIDTPQQEDLLAATKSIEEMRGELGATTLGFLSYKGMIGATGLPESSLSTSCFSGEYPIDILERRNEVRMLEI